MNNALWISKTGMQAQDTKLQTIANNLANVNTTGFKRDRAVFEDLFYQTEQQPGAQNATNATTTGAQLGHGSKLVGTQKIFTDGNTKSTGNPMDIAIIGHGFLQVELPSGDTGYTRTGELRLNEEGRLVTMQGYPILPAISIPTGATSMTIGENGTVSVTTASSAVAEEVGKLQLSTFVNPAGLLAMGSNLYAETAGSGTPTEGTPGLDGMGVIKQHVLEGSNVQAVEEMVELIATQRSYEMNTKIMSAADSMMQSLAQAAR